MVSDEKVAGYLALGALLILPWAGTQFGLWGLLWDFVLLTAVLWTGLKKGLGHTLVYLAAGYSIAGLYFGLTNLTEMGFVAWAGLFIVYGWEQGWSTKVTYFWGGVIGALLGSLPGIHIANQVVNEEVLRKFIDEAIKQYDKVGILETMQQQGITENQLRTVLEEALSIYHMLTPGLTALAALLVFVLVIYFLVPLFGPSKKARVPFAYWRLPWYAVWGVIIALVSYLVGDQFELVLLRTISFNIMLVYGVVALILGISLYVYFLRSPRIPRLLKWLIIMATIFSLAFSIITVITFGLFDLVFNFRRLPEQS